MLIQFNVGNFRSFKSLTTLNLEASADKEHEESVFSTSESLSLLKTAALFGANASGKSNLFSALAFMRNFTLNSSNAQITSKVLVEPFKLSTETEHKPSYFEILFVHEDTRYRYGFEVNTHKVFTEWLFNYPKGKETKLFTREGNEISVNKNKFPEGKKDLIDRTRQNALFLSTIAQFNGEISQKVISAFNTINIISGLNDQEYLIFSINKIKDDSFKKDILKFIQSADIDIEDFTTESIRINPENLPPMLTEEARVQLALQASQNSVKINTIHKKYNENNKLDSLVPFELGANESAGTNRLFFLSAPILDTLVNGKVLVIDEMDSRLHPLIMESLVKLFNSKEKNPKNAQLIFSAHSTLILCKKFFRRDQIWFTQKDRYGASELYSLDDYSVRKDSSFDKGYLLGKYGGIPIENIYDTQKTID